MTVVTSLALAPAAARSDTVQALAGVTVNGSAAHSYGWQLEFTKTVLTQLGTSVSWINEGHFAAHARDGAAAQVWWEAPRWSERVGLDLGVGPYLYFDTQPSASVRGYHDLHGAGAVVSAAVSVGVHGPFFLDLRANEILTESNISTLAVLLGAGYRFGSGSGSPVSLAGGADSTLQLFGGQAITNSLSARAFPIMGVDYRLGVARWAAWSATWFDDPAAARGQHDRVATQLWLRDRPISGLTFSVGLGPYLQLGALGPGVAAPARVSGLSALRVDWQLARQLSLIATWYRLFTQDDRDRDLLTAGIGWRFDGP